MLQVVLPTMLVSSVTAPVLANNLPRTPAPVLAVMLTSASTLPTSTLPVPRVAEVPTW